MNVSVLNSTDTGFTIEDTSSIDSSSETTPIRRKTDMATSKCYLIVAYVISCTVCCVHAACTAPSDCNHQGLCNGHLNECFCRTGWAGPACETDTRSSSKHFASYNLGNGATIPCTVGEKCVFPIFTRTFSGSQIIPFSIGPVHEDITVETGTPMEDEYLGTVTLLTVKTPTPGNKVFCLYHGSTDSLCYGINATTSNRTSSFIAPTFPDETTIPCNSDICHLNVYTEKTNQRCSLDLIHVANGTTASDFTPADDKQNRSCVTEIAFLSTSGYLCIKHTVPTRSTVDYLCYTIIDRSRIPDQCNQKTCSGHGACLPVGAEYQCICYSSYEGKDCEQSTLKAGQKKDYTAVIVGVAVSVPLVTATGIAAIYCIKKRWGKRNVSPEEKTSPDNEKGQRNDEEMKPGRLRKKSIHLVD